MTPPLPKLDDDDALDRLMADPDAVHRALVAAATAVGIEGEPVRFSRGSVPVATVGSVVLKLFPDFDPEYGNTEAACLATLDGDLPIPTPRLLERRALPGWDLLVMERLAGEPLADRWGDLDPATRVAFGRQIGEATAALNARTPPPELSRVDWPAWVAARTAGAVERQRARGAPDWILDAIPGWLDGADLEEGPRGTGWLHTEVMLEHVLIDGERLAGLVDFEPSFVAPVDYEWSSLGLFVGRGERPVWRAVLEGLGIAHHPEIPRRTLAMALVHRYANFAWYLKRLPADVHDLDDLAEAWFGVS